MFSGDIDLSERTDSMPWSQWSRTIHSYFGKFNRTTTWMLQQVEMSVDDPIITDNTVMTRAEERFSAQAQAYCVLVLTCGSKALQVVQRVPRGFGLRGMEAAVRGVRATSSSGQNQMSRCRWSVSKRAD